MDFALRAELKTMVEGRRSAVVPALLGQARYTVEGQSPLPSPRFWIPSCRHALGLSSARRTRHWVEPWLHFANLPIVDAFQRPTRQRGGRQIRWHGGSRRAIAGS